MIIMTGVVQWTCGGNKKRCPHHNYYSGTPNNATWTGTIKNLMHTAVLLILILGVMMTPSVSGQRQQSTRQQSTRRPNVSPALEAYRNRLMAHWNSRASSTTQRAPANSVGLRVGNDKGAAMVINGFPCERTYSFFPNRNNPRMYHLCARSRDSWYVYHYFCPHGTIYSDGMRKCMQDSRDEGNANSGNNISDNLSTNIRRPTNNVSNQRTTKRPPLPILRRTTTSTTTTTTTEAPTSSSSEEPEQNPEPDSDHTGVTDVASSEEAFTEDGRDVDVMVSLPGFTMTSSDEVDEDQAINENEASYEINMIVPQSVNGQSRLSSAVTTPASSSSSSSPVSTKQKQQTTLKRVPLKATKAAAVAKDDDESGNSFSSSTALGDRRPRILKKIKYWRDFLIGDQTL